MARPIKEGLDYFPLDVDIDQDDKIAVIEALHGVEGFGVVIKLLMKIYKEGYFYEWSQREQLIFSRRINVNINAVNEVVNDCIKEGLFNKEIYDSCHILTSRGIQKRYLEAVKRRKEVEFRKDIFLLSDIKSIVGSNKIDVFLVDDNNKRINVNINPTKERVNDNISTQRKEKERKEKERKEKNFPPDIPDDPQKELSVVEELIQNNIISPAGITKTLNDDLNDIYDNFNFSDTDQVIKEAIKYAARGNGKTWRFVYNRLDYWRKAGVKTVQDAVNLEEQGNSKQKGASTNAAVGGEFSQDWKQAIEQRKNSGNKF